MSSNDPGAPTPEQISLFNAVEAKMSTTCLQAGLWYLLVQTALVGCGEPDTVAQLYLYLISSPERQTTFSRQALVRRLRESLVKSIIIQGVPKNIDAILAISKVEREEDKDHTFTRRDWKSGPQNTTRGVSKLKRLYQGNLDDTLALFKDHEDFKMISTDITYGLFLADEQILNEIEAEVVILTGMVLQNLKTETRWHIRAFRRIGASKEDVQTVIDCAKMVGEHYQVKLDRIPKVEDVESEV